MGKVLFLFLDGRTRFFFLSGEWTAGSCAVLYRRKFVFRLIESAIDGGSDQHRMKRRYAIVGLGLIDRTFFLYTGNPGA